MTDFDCGIEEGWHQCERHDERRPKTRGCCAGCSPKCSAAGLCPRGGLGAGGSEGKPQVERTRRGGKTRSSCDWSGGRRLAGCSQLVLLSQAEATLRQAAWLFAAVDIMMRRTPRSRDFACLPGRSGSLSERPPQTEPVTTNATWKQDADSNSAWRDDFATLAPGLEEMPPRMFESTNGCPGWTRGSSAWTPLPWARPCRSSRPEQRPAVPCPSPHAGGRARS